GALNTRPGVARRRTRDTSRVGTGRESGTLGDPRAPHVAAGESRRDRRGTPAPPTPLCEACPARRRLAASPLRRHPPIERCAPGAYPACRAGFASRGTAVARGTVPSRSRLAPTRDMSLGSRSLVARVHQRRDGEPVVRDAGLLALVEVPALLAREAVARDRRLGGMVELHVDHDDRRREDAFLGILDPAADDLLADGDVVDPDLPELARAVVDVRVRDAPGLLVDEENTLAEPVLRQLGDALDHVYPSLLPHVVEGPVDLVVPLRRKVLAMDQREQIAFAEVLPVHPADLAGVAAVAVDVRVLSEEGVGALRRRETADAAQR